MQVFLEAFSDTRSQLLRTDTCCIPLILNYFEPKGASASFCIAFLLLQNPNILRIQECAFNNVNLSVFVCLSMDCSPGEQQTNQF